MFQCLNAAAFVYLCRKKLEGFGMDYNYKKFFSIASVIFSLVSVSFAQQELHDAVDNGDVATAQKIVKKGAAEEIYCGKLNPNDAVKVYEKIFKAMPNESFENCPTQFAYGYGAKVCANAKAMDACSEVTKLLLKDGEAGNVNAIETLDGVMKAIIKNKAFAKPVKEQVDTTAWVACPKKGKDRAACIEQCKVQSDSLADEAHKALCDSKPEQFIETTITVSKPSPLFEMLRTEIAVGYWKAPMSVAEKFSKLTQTYAKALSIADTAVVNLAYVDRWAETYKAAGSALPGGQLFRFCASWQPQVDSMLAAKEIATRCPVFETFVDPRDQQKYKVKEINGLKWFVQNLNFAVEEGSLCYDREEENCKAYGRQYNHATALTVCPEGTHLATEDEWSSLEELAGGASSAAEKLRSNGSDDFAFTALFGGHTNKNGFSVTAGEGAYFWMEDAADEGRSYARSMFATDRDVSRIPVDNGYYMSVRCVMNWTANTMSATEQPAE